MATAQAQDPLLPLIEDAFDAVCEAEKLIYAGGGNRHDKDNIIAAHSELLALRNRYRQRVAAEGKAA